MVSAGAGLLRLRVLFIKLLLQPGPTPKREEAVRGIDADQHRLRRHRNSSVGPASGTDGYLDILSEGGEKLHQALDGERSRAITHQRRDVRLFNAKYFASLRLCDAELPDKTVDPQRKLSFQQFLFRMGQAEIGENVSAVFRYG